MFTGLLHTYSFYQALFDRLVLRLNSENFRIFPGNILLQNLKFRLWISSERIENPFLCDRKWHRVAHRLCSIGYESPNSLPRIWWDGINFVLDSSKIETGLGQFVAWSFFHCWIYQCDIFSINKTIYRYIYSWSCDLKKLQDFSNISCIVLDFIMKVTFLLTPQNVFFDVIHENHEREKNEKGWQVDCLSKNETKTSLFELQRDRI